MDNVFSLLSEYTKSSFNKKYHQSRIQSPASFTAREPRQRIVITKPEPQSSQDEGQIPSENPKNQKSNKNLISDEESSDNEEIDEGDLRKSHGPKQGKQTAVKKYNTPDFSQKTPKFGIQLKDQKLKQSRGSKYLQKLDLDIPSPNSSSQPNNAGNTVKSFINLPYSPGNVMGVRRSLFSNRDLTLRPSGFNSGGSGQHGGRSSNVSLKDRLATPRSNNQSQGVGSHVASMQASQDGADKLLVDISVLDYSVRYPKSSKKQKVPILAIFIN